MSGRYVLALALFGAACAHAQTTALDTIVLTTGERKPARITGVDASGFSVLVPVVPGQPPASVKMARAGIAHIEFAADEAREATIARGTAAQVAALWQQWEPFLAIPRSPAARIGVRHGTLLVEAKDAKAARELFTRLEREAWSEEDRIAAKGGRLRAMVALGETEAALAEARELAKSATTPEVLIEAKYILASAADEALRKLVEENPRWEEDERVRPERHRLYHEAVDLYLYPYLAFGSRAEVVVRGLWRLIELYRFVGENQLALETARDVVSLYAETPVAKTAADWIASLPAEAKAEDYEAEARRMADPSPSPKPNEKK